MFSNFAPPAGDLHILAYPSQLVSFVKHFFKVFQTFSSCSEATRCRQLFYSITSSQVCQVLFSKFFKLFEVVGRCPPVLCALIRQLAYDNTSVCQVLFSKFFKLFEVVGRCPPVLCALIRQLAYDNTSCSICQALFYKFLHFLLVVFTSGHLSIFPGFFWTNRS